MSAQDALWQLAWMVLAGIVLGLMETAYAAHLRVLRFRRGWHDVSDLLVPLLGAAVVVAALALSNWGELRLWSLVGLALGYAVWRGLGAPLAQSALRLGNRAACRGCRWAAEPFFWAGTGLLQAGRRLAGVPGDVLARARRRR